MKLISFGALLLIACLAIGCGDDEEKSVTKAEYISQADAICKQQNEKKDAELSEAFEELQKRKTAAGRADEEKIIGDVALPPIAEMTEEVADLPLPAEQGDEAKKFVEEMETAVSEVEEDPAQALNGEPFGKAKARATRFGFKDCNNF